MSLSTSGTGQLDVAREAKILCGQLGIELGTLNRVSVDTQVGTTFGAEFLHQHRCHVRYQNRYFTGL